MLDNNYMDNITVFVINIVLMVEWEGWVVYGNNCVTLNWHNTDYYRLTVTINMIVVTRSVLICILCVSHVELHIPIVNGLDMIFFFSYLI